MARRSAIAREVSELWHHGSMVSLWRSWPRARGSRFPNRGVASVGGLAGCAVLQVTDEIERAGDEERATDEVPDRGRDEVPQQSVSSQTPAQLLRHTQRCLGMEGADEQR